MERVRSKIGRRPENDFPEMSSAETLHGTFGDNAISHPDQLAAFQILDVLGEGGMGIVYRALQKHPSRIVALKVLKHAANHQYARRFNREIAILAKLQHSSIAQLYSVGEFETPLSSRTPFLAMEFVEGDIITRYAHANRLGMRQKAELMARVCEAMAYAHHHGIIHRDLKPSNIMINYAGEPKILDFGIATIGSRQDSPTTITEEGQLLGTLDYMSPEQARGTGVGIDERTDVYALGAILYELLAGTRPFDHTSVTVIEALRRAQDTDSVTAPRIPSPVPHDLEIIVQKALARDRSQRYAHAADFGADLRRFLRSEPIMARRPTMTYKTRKFVWRHRVMVTSASLIISALSVGLVMAISQARRAEHEASIAQARARELKKQLADEHMLQGSLQQASGLYDLARGSYDQAWDLYADLKTDTLPVEMAMWDLNRHETIPLRPVETRNDPVKDALISSDQRLLVLAKNSGMVEVRDILTNTLRMRLDGTKQIQRLRLSPDNALLLITYEDSVSLRRITDSSEVWSMPFTTTLGWNFVAGNSVLLSSDPNASVRLRSIQDETTHDLPQINGVIDAVATGDGFTVLDKDRAVHRVTLSGETTRLGTIAGNPWSMKLSADGRMVLAIGPLPTLITLDDMSEKTFSSMENVHDAGFVGNDRLWFASKRPMIDVTDLDGDVLYCAPRDTSAAVFETSFALVRNSARILTLWASPGSGFMQVLKSTDGNIINCALSADGHLAALATDLGMIHVIDLRSNKTLLVAQSDASVNVKFLRFAADSSELYAAGGRTLHMWKLAGDMEHLTYEADGSIVSIASSGNSLYVTTQQASAIQEIAHGQLRRTLPAPWPGGYLSPSPDGAHLAVAWPMGVEILTFQNESVLKSHFDLEVTGSRKLAMLSQGKFALAQSRTIEIRDAQKGSLLRTIDSLPGVTEMQAVGSTLVVLYGTSLYAIDPDSGKMLHETDTGIKASLSMCSQDGRSIVLRSPSAANYLNLQSPVLIRSVQSGQCDLDPAAWNRAGFGMTAPNDGRWTP